MLKSTMRKYIHDYMLDVWLTHKFITLDYNPRGHEFESLHDCCHVHDIILPFTTTFSEAWCRGELKEKTGVG